MTRHAGQRKDARTAETKEREGEGATEAEDDAECKRRRTRLRTVPVAAGWIGSYWGHGFARVGSLNVLDRDGVQPGGTVGRAVNRDRRSGSNQSSRPPPQRQACRLGRTAT